VQPAAPVGSGECDDRTVRAIDNDGIVLGAALLTERIAVMPDRAGIGGIVRCGDG
jgi:hypothetical protein